MPLLPFLLTCILHTSCTLSAHQLCCLEYTDDRLVTHWLRVIGKHAPAAPLIDIELTQRADVLTSAKAKASWFTCVK